MTGPHGPGNACDASGVHVSVPGGPSPTEKCPIVYLSKTCAAYLSFLANASHSEVLAFFERRCLRFKANANKVFACGLVMQVAS